jgi:hypothetical protein
VAFSWTGPQQDNKDVYVQQIGTGSPLRLTTDPADDYSPMWSPDGRLIAFLRQAGPARHELRVIRRSAGPIRSKTSLWSGRHYDDRCMVPGACFVSSPIRKAPRRPTRCSPLLSSPARAPVGIAETVFMTDPAVSPDGKWSCLFVTTPLSGEMYRVPLGGNLTVSGGLAACAKRALRIQPEMDARRRGVLSRQSRGSGDWDFRRRSPDASGVRGRRWRDADGFEPAGPAARMIYVRSFVDMNIWRVNTSVRGAASTAPPVVAIASTRRDLIPQLSPDARQVAFMSNRSGELEVWRADPTGANPVQLTSLGAIPGFPRWSPDGESIAFHSNVGTGAGDILVIPAGGGKPRNLTNHLQATMCSPASRGTAGGSTSARPAEVMRICKVAASGGEAVRFRIVPACCASNQPTALISILSTPMARISPVH